MSKSKSLAGFTDAHILNLTIQRSLFLDSNLDNEQWDINESLTTSSLDFDRINQVTGVRSTPVSFATDGTITFTGLLSMTGNIDMNDNDIVEANIISSTSGQSLTLTATGAADTIFITNSTTRGQFKSDGDFNLTTGAYQINDVDVINATGLGSLVVGSSLTSLGTLTGLTVSAEIGSDGVDITTGNDYQINNVSVLNATTLGTSIVNSSLTSVGTLTSLAMGGNIDLFDNDLVNVDTIETTDTLLTLKSSSTSHTLGILTSADVGLWSAVHFGSSMEISNLVSDGDFKIMTTGTGALSFINIHAVLGFIGVGIDSPAHKLDVLGDINTSTDYSIGSTEVLSATTLGTGVINSSLRTLGTQSENLVMGSNDITGVGTITATTLAGTLSTAAQPNITSVGILTSLAMGGILDMNTNNISDCGLIQSTDGTNLDLRATGTSTSVRLRTGTSNTIVFEMDENEICKMGSSGNNSQRLNLHNQLGGGDCLINLTNATTFSSDGMNIGVINSGEAQIKNKNTAGGGKLSFYTRNVERGFFPENNHFNLITGNEYQINETSVLTSTTLGSAVVNSSLTNVGTLTALTVSAEIVSDGIDVTTGNDYQINNVSVLNSTTLGTSVVGSSLTSVGTLSSLIITGNLTVDTDTLFIDSSGNFVGIGTTSPNECLHIENDQNGSTRIRIKNDTSGTAASVGFVLSAFGGSSDILHLNSGFTSSGDKLADGLLIAANTSSSGGITIAAEESTAEIRFFTGGNGSGNERGQFKTDGDFNLVTGGAYQINDVDVINATGLGSLVVDSSLTSVGTLTTLTINGTMTADNVNATAFFFDEKTSGTNGGTFTSGSYQTRDLNTTSGDTSFSSLSANVITISVTGTYDCSFSSPGFIVNAHKTKLRRTNNTPTDLIIGESEQADSGNGGYTTSTLFGTFTATANDTLELQHRCQTTRATNGFGVAAGFGEVEVYSLGWIKRVL